MSNEGLILKHATTIVTIHWIPWQIVAVVLLSPACKEVKTHSPQASQQFFLFYFFKEKRKKLFGNVTKVFGLWTLVEHMGLHLRERGHEQAPTIPNRETKIRHQTTMSKSLTWEKVAELLGTISTELWSLNSNVLWKEFSDAWLYWRSGYLQSMTCL